jgi:hypothetical protein
MVEGVYSSSTFSYFYPDFPETPLAGETSAAVICTYRVHESSPLPSLEGDTKPSVHLQDPVQYYPTAM